MDSERGRKQNFHNYDTSGISHRWVSAYSFENMNQPMKIFSSFRQPIKSQDIHRPRRLEITRKPVKLVKIAKKKHMTLS